MNKLSISIIFLGLLSSSTINSQKKSTKFDTNSLLITDICYTPNGEALAVVDENNIKLFASSSVELLGEFSEGHSSKILAIDISKDLSLLVSGGTDNTIVIWDFAKRTVIQKIPCEDGAITTVKISDNKKYLAWGTNKGQIYLYDLINDTMLLKTNDHENLVTAVDINPQETLLATTGGDKNVNLYSIPQSKLLTRLSEHTNWVRDVTFNLDGTKLVSCGDDGHAIIRNITNPQNIRVFSNYNLHSGALTSVDVFTDNKSIIYGSLSGRVNIQCERVCYKASVNAPINKAKFTPDNSNRIIISVATQGAGVLLIDAIDMKMSNDK